MQILNDLITFALYTALPQALNWLVFFAAVWVPIVTFEYAEGIWKKYLRMAWIAKTPRTLLEIRLPRETNKSPLAMELVLNAIHNTSDGNWYRLWWFGESRPWYSLEMASFEGKVRFFANTESKRKAGLISALYSQYPGVEVKECEDYASLYVFNPKEDKIWATEFKLTKEDAYPIKTYVDYGLDKDPKEEYKIDPLTPGLEWLGSVGPKQQVWIQFVVRAHKGHWKKQAEEIVDEIMHRDPKTKMSGEINEDGAMIKPVLSEGEREIISAVARSVMKHGFDVGIRTAYIAKKDMFDTPFGIGGIISFFKHFSSGNLNGFAPAGTWVAAVTDFPWQDYKNYRRNERSTLFVDAYRRRNYFHPPFMGKSMVLNTEELATMFHFPGSVAGAPTLERIPSKRADAPSNLPV